jgi:hypothetical protein
MENEILVKILFGVIGLLLTIVGFIGMFIIKKLEKGNELLASIDKHVGMLDIKVANNEKAIDRNEEDLKDVKEKVNVLQTSSKNNF